MASTHKRCRDCRAFRNIAFVLIFGAFLSLLGTTEAKGESAPILYTLRVSCIRDDIAMHIRRGDSVTDPVGKAPLGRVVDIRYKQSVAEGYDAEKNEMVISEVDGYSDIYITVSAKGEQNGAILRLDSYSVHIGKWMPLRLPDFYGEGVCVGINGGGEIENGA